MVWAGPGELLNALAQAAEQAAVAVAGIAAAGPAQGSGTTLTAMLWSGSRLALVHIGDSRAYLLRDGQLFQITHDHTVVQNLIDEGRLTAEEARSHPQRALLLRALGAAGGGTPDLSLHEARPGDRYLLCSDGLSAVVPAGRIHEALCAAAEPGAVVAQLVELANQAGGPDNVSCVVADVAAAAWRAGSATPDGQIGW